MRGLHQREVDLRRRAADAWYFLEAIGSRVGNGYDCKGRSKARSQASLAGCPYHTAASVDQLIQRLSRTSQRR